MSLKIKKLPLFVLLALRVSVPACADSGVMSQGAVLLPPSDEILRADFRVIAWTDQKPRAVLVLCPGQNGDGKEYLSDPAWRDFVRKERFAIVIPAFASSDWDLMDRKGYFEASRGSGEMLLGVLESAGWSGLPIFLYGFSGGAHFAMTFAASFPQRVRAFCAYSFAWWSPPPDSLKCPALIACGESDAVRHGSALAYFQSGRSAGKPWTWIALPGQEHDTSPMLESFAREFISAALHNSPESRVEVDNATGAVVKGRAWNPIFTSVLPSATLREHWWRLHSH